MKYIAATVLLISISGCAHTSVPLLFEPVSTSNISTIYVNGLPIASVSVDSLFLLLSLDQADIAHVSYLRLWTLVQNASDSAILLEPSKIFTITAVPRTSSDAKQEYTMQPQSPAKILNQIEDQEAVHSIVAAIGGALESATTKNTTVTSNRGETYEVHDAPEKRKVIEQQTTASLASISNWYSIFKSSITSGILRKNTLFPGQSVNGYIYFQKNMWIYSRLSQSIHVYDAEDFDYKILVQSAGGPKTIEFKIITGE